MISVPASACDTGQPFGLLAKLRIPDSRHLGFSLELDARDLESVIDPLDPSLRVRMNASRREPSLAEAKCQRH